MTPYQKSIEDLRAALRQSRLKAIINCLQIICIGFVVLLYPLYFNVPFAQEVIDSISRIAQFVMTFMFWYIIYNVVQILRIK